MQKIEHVREFRENDIGILATNVMLLAACGELVQTPEYIDFKTIDVALVISAILKVIEENTGDTTLTKDIVHLLHMSDKNFERSVEL